MPGDGCCRPHGPLGHGSPTLRLIEPIQEPQEPPVPLPIARMSSIVGSIPTIEAVVFF